jgi:hypothetical protein
MEIGHRISVKIRNAPKFAVGLGPTLADAAVSEAVDQAMRRGTNCAGR